MPRTMKNQEEIEIQGLPWEIWKCCSGDRYVGKCSLISAVTYGNTREELFHNMEECVEQAENLSIGDFIIPNGEGEENLLPNCLVRIAFKFAGMTEIEIKEALQECEQRKH